MANTQNLSFFLIIFSLFATLNNPCLALSDDRKVYIVYLGALPSVQVDPYSVQSQQLSILQKVLQDSSVADRLVHSYKRSFNGFAALLTEEEQQQIASMEGVVSVFPSRMQKLHTTRSWDFLGLTKTVKRVPVVESDIIVGFLDTGIWPESESFSDEGFSPPPKKWKGICQTEGNFTCNNKLIGARYYKECFKKECNVRDTDGHGTHTSSTAAGREVSGVSLYGLAQGDARGAVPSARIAMYRVCGIFGCPDSSILAAFDDAIADGVDVISVSLGLDSATNYSNDIVSIGAFHASLKGILTSQAAGNSGPVAGSVSSVAPWIFTVAASSTDRDIITKAILGDGTVVQGKAINTFPSTKSVPLILGANASTANCSTEEAQTCSSECLDKRLVTGKIVLCEKLNIGYGVLLASGIGQIVGVAGQNDFSFIFPLPSTGVDLRDAEKIKSYIVKTKEAQVKIYKSESIRDARAPVTLSFSSRGPNAISSNILKPDISAPGVDILAAYSPVSSLTDIDEDKRYVKYNIMSGTSMACPHVSGAAAYVKTFHPNWSPAAIKSALMTTASLMNARSNPEAEFAFGAGQINPVKAVDPGLVYDANKDDYIQFMCNEGYSAKEISLISGENVNCSRVSNGSARDLNYPSMQLLVATNKPFSSTFSRSVTNVGSPVSTYNVTVNQHPQLQIVVKPAILSFKQLNEKQSFTVIVTGRGLKPLSILSSSLVWSDGVHSVRSPIVVYTSNITRV